MKPGPALLVAAALLSYGAGALAVNKCTDANGKTVYQDRPCAGAGKTIDIRPNSIDGTPNADVVKALRDYDKLIADRMRADEEHWAARNKNYDDFRRQCQSYIDSAERQAAWLTSISPAARASAAAEINIARRKYYDDQCWNPNVRF